MTYITVVPREEIYKRDLAEKIRTSIRVTSGDDDYQIGMRNGMRFCLSLVEDEDPTYEDISPRKSDTTS